MTKHITLLTLSVAAATAQPWSSVLSTGRAIDWSNAGATMSLSRSTVCATLTSAATLTQINSAISSCPSGQVVSLGAGVYGPYAGQISVRNSGVTVRGAGPMQTILTFTSGGGGNGLGTHFYVAGTATNDSTNTQNTATWTAGYTPGTTSITIGAITQGSASNLRVGEVLVLDQLDDGNTDPGEDIYACGTQPSSVSPNPACSWQGNTEGNGRGCSGSQTTTCRAQQQMVTVTSVTPSTGGVATGTGPWTVGISTENPDGVTNSGLYDQNWSAGRSPGAWFPNSLPVTGVGIEDLTLDTTSDTTGNGSQFMFVNAQNCWIYNVRSLNNTSGKHVWLYIASHITIQNSYFYGSNPTSNAYGVDFGNSSTDNLAINNEFQHIATPVIGEGASDNVGAYNYAIDDFYQNGDPAWEQSSDYHHTEGDHYFLFEGNIGVGLTGDDVHGTSWMWTAFRNRYSGRDMYGGSNGGKTQQTIAVDMHAYTRFWNLVGNVLGTSGYHTNYQVAAANATDAGSATLTNVSIYEFGYSGAQGTYNSCCNNDYQWTLGTSMRWGNYDTVTGAVRWCVDATSPCTGSEVPSGLVKYPNSVPANHTLPSSFFLTSIPSWWGTPWGNPPWPSVGPDVSCSANCVASVGGYVAKNPAELCWENSSTDTNYKTGSSTYLVRGGSGSLSDASGLSIKQFDASSCYIGQSVSFTPGSLNLGSTPTGTTTSAQSTTMRNNTASQVTGIAASIVNATGATFTISANTCGSGPLNAGASCSYSVTCTPSVVGSDNGTLQVTDSAGTQSVPLSCTGTTTAPSISCSPASIAFGNVNINTASGNQTSTCTNTGNATATGVTVTLGGTNSGDFSVSTNPVTNCGGSLAVNGTCTLTASTTPLAVGSRTASVSVASNAPTATVSLSVTGVDPTAPAKIAVTSCPSQSYPATTGAVCTIPSVTGGDLLAIGFSSGSSFTIASVTTNKGDACSPATNAYSGVTDIWYCPNVTAAATQITVIPQATVSMIAGIYEIKNVNSLDQSANLQNQTSSSTPKGPAVTIPFSKELIFSIVNPSASANGVSSPWTYDGNLGSRNPGFASIITTTSGTYQPSFTLSSAGTSNSSTASFVQSAASVNAAGGVSVGGALLNGNIQH